MTTVYGHGSWFAGVDDPSDVDVLVVTEETMTRREALTRVVAPLVRELGAPAGLPVDVTVAHPERLSTFERVAIHHGRLLAGPEVPAAPVRPHELAYELGRFARQEVDTRRAAAALAAVAAILGAPTKSAVPELAAGGPWEDLAGAAWAARRAPTFDHPDLEDALVEAAWAAAGEASTRAWEARRVSSRANRAALLTVYRRVLTGAELERLVALPAEHVQDGGRRKGRVEEPELLEALGNLTTLANAYWWGQDVIGLEPLEVHRYRPGDSFGWHVDRIPMFPTRFLNVVVMVHPADAGGRLELDLGGAEPIRPELEPGDVVVLDGGVLHRVSPVEAGERTVAVTHAHARRPLLDALNRKAEAGRRAASRPAGTSGLSGCG